MKTDIGFDMVLCIVLLICAFAVFAADVLGYIR